MSDVIFNFKSMIIGHRGAKGRVMENTLESILYAIDLGVDGIEIDIRRCYTGDIILFHDETLDRLAFKDEFYFDKTKEKPISKLQWYHLYNTDLINSLGRKYKIPRLIDVLRHPKIYNSDILINICIRDMTSHEDLVSILTDVIDEGLYEPGRFMISSSYQRSLDYLREFINDSSKENQKYQKMKIGAIYPCDYIREKDLLIDVQKRSKVVTHLVFESSLSYLLKSSLFDQCKKLGLNIFVHADPEQKSESKSESNSEQNLENIVDGIITDHPENYKFLY